MGAAAAGAGTLKRVSKSEGPVVGIPVNYED
jgi:hypothetical protein